VTAGRAELEAPARGKTLVLGVGSPLISDDGLGLAALERLRTGWRIDPQAELVDGGTWGMNLLPLIEEAERLLILDAIDLGAEPGTLAVLERADLPRYLCIKLSPHQIDLREVLALADLRGTLPVDAVAIGLQPASLETSIGLSDAVCAGLPMMTGAALDRLRSWGHRASAARPGPSVTTTRGCEAWLPPPRPDVPSSRA
jgi:hydrogenase maturation protease